MFRKDPKHVFDALRNFIICGALLYFVFWTGSFCYDGKVIEFGSFSPKLLFILLLIIYLAIWNFVYYTRKYVSTPKPMQNHMRGFIGIPVFILVAIFVVTTESDIRMKYLEDSCKYRMSTRGTDDKLKEFEIKLKRIEYGENYW